MSDEDDSGAQLDHPDILRAVQTCSAVPDQWEGELRDGRAFYYRYRFGRVTLAVGPGRSDVAGITHPTEAGPATQVAILGHGDGLSGMFETDEERSEIFGQLLAEIT